MRFNKFINVTLYVLVFLVVSNAYAKGIYSNTDLNGRDFEQGLLNETKIEVDAFLHADGCPCTNGKCELENGKLVCKCNPEYGLYKAGECKACDCGKNMNCTFTPGLFSDGKKCVYPAGYQELAGLCRGSCRLNPCRRGTCGDGPGTQYKCICPKGYFGDKCEIKDLCLSIPCQNGGTCSMIGDKMSCTCPVPTSGNNCEITPCSRNPCKNGGTCTVTSTGFNCTCRSKYTGTICDLGDCRCENGRCESEGGRSVCVCNPGYGLIDIGSCAKCNCGKDYGCIFQRIIHHSEKECLCPNNYIDIGGKCKGCRCGENEICTTEGDEICICKEGFGRKDDVCTKRCRDDSMCQNGGYCMEDLNGSFCECKSGTSGDMCSVIDACEDNHFCGSGTDVTCIYDLMEEKPRCVCQDAMEQYDEITKMCRKIETCNENNPCENGGECVDGPDGSFCDCKNGTSGEFCSVVDACMEGKFCGPDSDVICSYDPVKEKPYCECEDLLKQFDASEKKCKTKCDEVNYPCQNGGKCSDDSEKPFCYCRPGTGGDLCTVVDACERDSDLCGPGKDVKCVYDVTEEKTYCACEDPSKQYDAMTKECRITHPCLSHPCQHGGTCFSHEMEYTCKCISGYSGENCENDPCSSLPCKNGGICEVNGDSYSCYCPHPFRGNNCELGPCSDNPCENEGECKTLFRSFRCICKPPFFGLRCEKDACHGNPCKNGGLCKALDYGYKCFCSSPFSGFHCEKGPCSDRPCKNDGICQVEGNGYRCFCRAPYCGKSCEIENCNCGNGKCNQKKIE